ALPAAPRPRRRAAGRGTGQGGRDRLLGRPEPQPGQRLVALRPGGGAARAGQEGRGGGRAGTLRQGLGASGREAHGLAFLSRVSVRRTNMKRLRWLSLLVVCGFAVAAP